MPFSRAIYWLLSIHDGFAKKGRAGELIEDGVIVIVKMSPDDSLPSPIA